MAERSHPCLVAGSLTVAGEVPTERQVQRGIIAMLRSCFPEVLYHHSPNGAHLAGAGSAKFAQVGALKGDGMQRGFPDLICAWDGGLAFIEVKRPKLGKLSDEQKALHERIAAIGWPVATVNSIEAAHAFLKGCGAPCRGELA